MQTSKLCRKAEAALPRSSPKEMCSQAQLECQHLPCQLCSAASWAQGSSLPLPRHSWGLGLQSAWLCLTEIPSSPKRHCLWATCHRGQTMVQVFSSKLRASPRASSQGGSKLLLQLSCTPPAMETWNHTITEWAGLERTLDII